jgi:hypothetical protein
MLRKQITIESGHDCKHVPDSFAIEEKFMRIKRCDFGRSRRNAVSISGTAVRHIHRNEKTRETVKKENTNVCEH